MEAMIMINFSATVDARQYEPKDKHPTIFNTFLSLNSGETMQLVNDHDPRPLHYQFMMEMPEQFEWEYLEQGPEVWRVAIKKR
jgi:uncharacterized protein (DUF2249 family)